METRIARRKATRRSLGDHAGGLSRPGGGAPLGQRELRAQLGDGLEHEADLLEWLSTAWNIKIEIDDGGA